MAALVRGCIGTLLKHSVISSTVIPFECNSPNSMSYKIQSKNFNAKFKKSKSKNIFPNLSSVNYHERTNELRNESNILEDRN